eukprot:scaffold113340_cov45-Prasinocladus_malaysianus.AAC.1
MAGGGAMNASSTALAEGLVQAARELRAVSCFSEVVQLALPPVSDGPATTRQGQLSAPDDLNSAIAAVNLALAANENATFVNCAQKFQVRQGSGKQ